MARNKEIDLAISLIKEANKELPQAVDLIVFPEAVLNVTHFEYLETQLQAEFNDKAPSIIIAGVRERKEDLENKRRAKDQFNFSSNAFYCKYMDQSKLNKPPGECYRHLPDSDS